MVPAALKISRVLPTIQNVIVEAGLARSLVDLLPEIWIAFGWSFLLNFLGWKEQNAVKPSNFSDA